MTSPQPKPQYLTVVYTINSPEDFLEENERLQSLFTEPQGRPWAITAMSVDHEIHRMDLIASALHSNQSELIETIISHPEIGNVIDIDALE
jgi:hypothetical protein